MDFIELEYAFTMEAVELHSRFYTFSIKYNLCTNLLPKTKNHCRIRTRQTISFMSSFGTQLYYLHSALTPCICTHLCLHMGFIPFLSQPFSSQANLPHSGQVRMLLCPCSLCGCLLIHTETLHYNILHWVNLMLRCWIYAQSQWLTRTKNFRTVSEGKW